MKELEPWTEYLKFVGKKETKCDCSEVPKCSGCCNKGLPPLKYYGIQEWIWCPHCRKELGNRKSNKEICNTWQKHSIKLGTFALVLENQREVQGIVTVAEPEAVSQLPGGAIPVPHSIKRFELRLLCGS
jgi:hypothetical protein